jgi:hypothetical protein
MLRRHGRRVNESHGGINALLSEKAAMLKWLMRTVELGDANYPWFQRDKTCESLRADPEYQSIMAGIRQQWPANKQKFDPGVIRGNRPNLTNFLIPICRGWRTTVTSTRLKTGC